MVGKRDAVWHLAYTSSCFLAVENLAILHLLLHLERTHLAVLLLLKLLSLEDHRSRVALLSSFDLFVHLVLAHLAVKYALVGILHLRLNNALLVQLLGGPYFLLLCFLEVSEPVPFLFLLLADGEFCHVLLVDVSLLLLSLVLGFSELLLIRVPGVVVELGLQRQVASGLGLNLRRRVLQRAV